MARDWFQKLFFSQFQNVLLFTKNKNDAYLADALIDGWSDSDFGEYIKPILEKLVSLGIKMKIQLPFKEEVPDSTYAMF